jgi:hypothetical protein
MLSNEISDRDFTIFFKLRRSKILLDHWPKPFKVRVITFSCSPSNTGEGPNHQSFILNPLRKSKQHFTALHFFKAHRSRIGIPIPTFSVVSASMRRCLPPEIFHNAKSSGPPSHNLLHNHTSDLQQFEIYQDVIEQSHVRPDKTLDTVHTTLLSSCCPSY